MIATGHVAEVEYRAGRWDQAIAHAEQAISLATDTEQLWLLAFVHTTAAFPLARRGSWDQTEHHVDRAQQCAQITHTAAAYNYASTASAMLALSRGEPDLAIEATDQIASWRNIDGLFEPGMLPWPELRAEALVRAGRFGEAALLLDKLLELAGARGRHSTFVAAHHVRGLLDGALGHSDNAAFQFTQSLQHAQHVAMPFEQALTQLQYGAQLRRTGQRRHAAAHLRQAEQTLSALNAAPFLSLARAELVACGLTPRVAAILPQATLTPQELAIAQLVTQGFRNRDIAGTLFVSTKTVEFHLRNIYRKLNLRTRVHSPPGSPNRQPTPEARRRNDPQFERGNPGPTGVAPSRPALEFDTPPA